MWCAIWIKALKFVLLVAFNQRNKKKKKGVLCCGANYIHGITQIRGACKGIYNQPKDWRWIGVNFAP
jgi:hypothetical protein